jgi:uncharacterized protein YhfF
VSDVRIDLNACKVVWEEYLRGLPQTHAHQRIKPDAFAFGDSEALANELADLVLIGRKRATASLAVEFTSLNEPIPRAGDVSIILRGDGTPVAIVERTDVQTVPFQAVNEVFAATEGEGDGTLAYWRAAHTEYFNAVCMRLGGKLSATTPVLCQTFRVLWRTHGPGASSQDR